MSILKINFDALYDEYGPWLFRVIIIFVVLLFIYISYRKNRKSLQKKQKAQKESYKNPLTFQHQVFPIDKAYSLGEIKGNKVLVNIYHPPGEGRLTTFAPHISLWFKKETVPDIILNQESFYFIKL